jgi:hypothetical protein
MATKTGDKVQAREACVIVVGARPIEYQRRIVRDRHTCKLAEIDMHELPPVDPGSEGIGYAFKAGEEAWADHPAVKDAPGLFPRRHSPPRLTRGGGRAEAKHPEVRACARQLQPGEAEDHPERASRDPQRSARPW